MISRDFALQVAGYGLVTAQIHYPLPNHPSVLQVDIVVAESAWASDDARRMDSRSA